MRLVELSLTEFRNVEGPATLAFDERFTVLWGHNGAGKTNLLEAIYLVSTLRSFRTTDQAALVRRGSEHARVELVGHDDEAGLSTRLEVRLDQTERALRRTAKVDGKIVRSAVEFYGRVPAVLFTPEDLAVLRGGPNARRQFIDRVLFARERTHIGDVQTYDRVVRTRNRVLRSQLPPGECERLLEAYDPQLAELGARIWSRRVELIDELRPGFGASFAQIHERADARGAAGIEYVSRLGSCAGQQERRARMLAGLLEHRSRDRAVGRTTVGPHLDDVRVSFDGRSAAEFASQGQTRALVLAFKIAELRSARSKGSLPLLLLDDVSSELDPLRTARLFEVLANEVGQCVLTTTTPRYLELGEARRSEFQMDAGRWSAAR